MLQEKTFTTELDGKKISISTGKLAGQAGGAVTVRQGDTVLMATATMSRETREGIGFFPLTVDYEERLYAGGRIPGAASPVRFSGVRAGRARLPSWWPA